MESELTMAAKEMLTAISGMYIEFVDREAQVEKAENRLRAAVRYAESAEKSKTPCLLALNSIERCYYRKPEPVPPFNWHAAIIECLGEGVDDEDLPNEEYRRSLVEAGTLVVGAITALDKPYIKA